MCILFAILSVACAQKAPAPLTERDPLPLLTRREIAPRHEVEKFTGGNGSYRFIDPSAQQPPKEPPFEADAQAVAAAQAWIAAHFGEMPSGVTLQVKTIDHSSSGRAAPAYDWDHGHTISFTELYRGIPTDSGAIIYITGRTSFNATIDLYEYFPVSGSERKIVSGEVASKSFRDLWVKAGHSLSADELAQWDRTVKPRLVYVWSPLTSELQTGAQTDKCTAPTWALDTEGRIMVDGQTGKIWEND